MTSHLDKMLTRAKEMTASDLMSTVTSLKHAAQACKVVPLSAEVSEGINFVISKSNMHETAEKEFASRFGTFKKELNVQTK